MSTRATYRIKDKRFQRNVSQDIYIHYDGYPEGAATYFNAFLNYQNDRGTAIEKFIRANELAEFTDRCENHTDREFHYEYDNSEKELTAFSCDWDSNKLKMIYTGTIEDFIKKYL